MRINSVTTLQVTPNTLISSSHNCFNFVIRQELQSWRPGQGWRILLHITGRVHGSHCLPWRCRAWRGSKPLPIRFADPCPGACRGEYRTPSNPIRGRIRGSASGADSAFRHYLPLDCPWIPLSDQSLYHSARPTPRL